MQRRAFLCICHLTLPHVSDPLTLSVTSGLPRDDTLPRLTLDNSAAVCNTVVREARCGPRRLAHVEQLFVKRCVILAVLELAAN